MDNYSKMILGHAVSEKLSFSLISEAINDAVRKVEASDKKEQIFLVADGGKENNNHQVDALIADISICTLSKLVALKDIQFSNSPIEAIHKIIKGRYLKNRKFETMGGLENFLKLAVEDYNCLRPHYKHASRTPHEVYYGLDLNFDVKERMKKAAKKRMDANRHSSCKTCTHTSCDKPCLSALEMPTPALS